MKFRAVKLIDVSDFDKLVEDTYNKPYNFQQQDYCKSRGTYEFTLPLEGVDKYDNKTVPEVVNHREMGVCFEAWIERDPNEPLSSGDTSIRLWWDRNFYPCVDEILDDLYKKNLLEDGDYIIDIDW